MARRSIFDLQEQSTKIIATTAYDVTLARLVDPWVDLVLVGDSLGMVVQGKENTLDVSIEEMVYHTQAVHRGLKLAHLVSDLPFLSYQLSQDEAVKNAGLLLKAGAQSVKLEGGSEFSSLVKRLVTLGIPVLGHLGMTPQSLNRWGGYKVQGKEEARKDELLRDAKVLEEAGAYGLVLESIPTDLAALITDHAQIPTIGIGAGNACDGQILVIYDLLGMEPSFKPKFLRRFSNVAEQVEVALKTYRKETDALRFPSENESYF